MSDKIMALFEDESLQNLSEDFKVKAALIFEAALSEKVSLIREELETANEVKLEEMAETGLKEMEQKLDDYITYTADQWMQENALAIEGGIKHEISESFLSGMKNLFTEHYVDIPEDKVDVVKEMAGTVIELEDETNKAVNENIDLKRQNVKLVKESVVRMVSDKLELADSEIDKLVRMTEEVHFEDEEQFTGKVRDIAEMMLGKVYESDDDDEDDKGGDDDDDEGDDDKKDKKKGGKPKKGVNPFEKKNESFEDVDYIAESMTTKSKL